MDEEEELDDLLPERPEWPGAEPKQAAFLTALIIVAGQAAKAARAARIPRQSHYRWLDTDENYRKLYAFAMRQVTQTLEDEATRRAVEGVKRGVYYQGERCGTEIVHSDGLMMFLLRGAAPEKYRERSELSGKVDLNLKFAGTMEELLAMYRRIAMTEEEPQ